MTGLERTVRAIAGMTEAERLPVECAMMWIASGADVDHALAEARMCLTYLGAEVVGASEARPSCP